jgi:hypothetical protein
MLKDRWISWKAAEVYMDAIMFSYFSPLYNNVNGVNRVEFQFDQIIDV